MVHIQSLLYSKLLMMSITNSILPSWSTYLLLTRVLEVIRISFSLAIALLVFCIGAGVGGAGFDLEAPFLGEISCSGASFFLKLLRDPNLFYVTTGDSSHSLEVLKTLLETLLD